MRKCAVLACLLLAGCGSLQTEKVYLARTDGQRVTCGPYDAQLGDQDGQAMQMRLRQCVSDYQRQGYERVPGP
jgi:hypothetical protein